MRDRTAELVLNRNPGERMDTAALRPTEELLLHDWRLLVGLAVVLTAYTIPLGRYPKLRDPNELSRILASVSMVVHGTLTIDRAMTVYGMPGDDRAVYQGHTYSEKAPGSALFATPVVALARLFLPERDGLPGYWPLRHLLTFTVIALPGALLPFLLMRDYPELEFKQRIALATLFALATPMLTYATHFHSHVLAAFLVGVSYWLALKPGQSTQFPQPRAAVLSGWMAGSAVMVEYPTALLGLVIFTALAVRTRSLKLVGCFAAGGLVGILPMLAYHQAAYGAVWETGYSHEASPEFQAVHEQGLIGIRHPTAEALWGVLLSARRGMVFYCPLLLIVPVGLVRMARRGREAWPLVVAAAVYLAFAASFVLWTGGSSAAARHLVPLLPLLLFPIAEAAALMARRVWTWLLFTALVGCSLAGSLLSIAVTPYFPAGFKVPLSQVTLRSLRDGAAFPNLVTDLTGLPATWALIGLTVLLTAAAIIAVAQFAPPRRARGWTAVVLPMAMAAYVGFQVAISPSPTTLQESNRSVLLEQIGYERQARQIRTRLRALPPGPIE